MKYRPLGRTGLDGSEAGFACGADGGTRTILPVEISPEYFLFFLIRLVMRARKVELVRKPE